MCENKRKLLTLVLPVDRVNGRVLLGWKKRGFGRNKWNGFGGKVEPTDRSVVAAALRELSEESGLVGDEETLRHAGRLLFEFVGDPVWLEVHVFEINQWMGTPIESEEMLPAWFPMTEMPFDAMWPDDRQWIPLVLKQQEFEAFFQFQGDDQQNHITQQRIKLLSA